MFIVGYFACKGKCKSIVKVSRRTEIRKRCDPCGYYTLITERTWCPCCGKKYKIRKTGQIKSEVSRIE